jgi:hypothetical protein
MQQLIRQLYKHRALTLAVHNMVVRHADRDGEWLELGEPGAAGAHVRCSTRVCDPVRISVRVGQASVADTCAGGELSDLGAVGRCGRRGGNTYILSGRSLICAVCKTLKYETS